jgi:hypothetical protein
LLYERLAHGSACGPVIVPVFKAVYSAWAVVFSMGCRPQKDAKLLRLGVAGNDPATNMQRKIGLCRDGQGHRPIR